MQICEKDEFKCKDNSGQCIQNTLLCDKKNECNDGSDEEVNFCKVSSTDDKPDDDF